MKLKKLTALLSAMCMLFCCTVPAVKTDFAGTVLSVSAEEGYPFKTTSDYVYNQLTAEEQTLYDDLIAACTAVDESSETYEHVPEVYYTDLTFEQA